MQTATNNTTQFTLATPTPRDDEHYVMCAGCAARHHNHKPIDASWAYDGEYQCEYCNCHGTTCDCIQPTDNPTPNNPIRPSTYSDYLATYTQGPNDTKYAQHRAKRHDTALTATRWIKSHGIDAHTTLTGMVRAWDHYTYRDADNMLCNGGEWALLDPTQQIVIDEFLGY